MKRLFLSCLTMLLLGCSLAWAQQIVTISGTITVQGNTPLPADLKLVAGRPYNTGTIVSPLPTTLNTPTDYSTQVSVYDNVTFALGTNEYAMYGDYYPNWCLIDDGGNEVNTLTVDVTGNTTVNLVISPKGVGGGGSAKATLYGSVISAPNQGISNATVAITDGGSFSKTTSTTQMEWDEAAGKMIYGYYRFKDIPSGEYTLTYTKEGYVTSSKQVTVNAETSTTVEVPTVTMAAASADYVFYGNIHYLNGDDQTVYVDGATITAYDGLDADANVLGTPVQTNGNGEWTMTLSCKAGAVVYFYAEHPNIMVANRTAAQANATDGNSVDIFCTEKIPDLPGMATYKIKQAGTASEPRVEVSWTWPQELLNDYIMSEGEGGIYQISSISIIRTVYSGFMSTDMEVGKITPAKYELPATSFVDNGIVSDYDGFAMNKTYRYQFQITYKLPTTAIVAINSDKSEERLNITLQTTPVQTEEVTLTLNVNNDAWGTVSGAGTYEKNDQVMIYATPNKGYLFKEWQKDGNTYATSATYKTIVASNMTLTAVFEERPPIYDSVTLKLNVNNVTMGTVEGAGRYAKGETVTATATAKSGYVFKQWKSGTAILSTKPSYTFILNTDSTLTAMFEREVVYRGMTNCRAKQISADKVRLDWEWPQALKDDYKKADGSGLYEISQISIKRRQEGNQYPVDLGIIRPETYSLPPVYYVDTMSLKQDSTYTYFFLVQYSAPANKDITVNGDGSEQRLTVKMVADVMPVQFYTVSLNVNEGMGMVAGAGDHFEAGDEVTVTATAKSGYVFQCWKEGETEVSRSAIYTFTVSGNRMLTAVFVPQSSVTMVTLTLNVNNTAMGTATIVGVAGGEVEFAEGTSVTVTARSNEGYVFQGWKNGAQTVSTSAVYTFTLNENLTLTAVFAAKSADIETYTVTLLCDEAMGTVTGAGTYGEGDKVTVTATPKSGYLFKGWMENGEMLNGAGATYEFYISGNRTLTAVFSDKVDVILLVNNPNMGTVTGDGQYVIGAEVTVKAMPKAGYIFQSWMSGQTVVATTAEYKLVVNNDITLMAVFAQDPNAEKVTLLLNVNDTAMGTVIGAGQYVKGAEVTVRAVAKGDYKFRTWVKGEEVVSTDAEYTFTLNEDLTLTAVFAQGVVVGGFALLTLEVNDETMGMVTGAGRYEKGVGVTVKAIPYLGYVFQAWKNGEETVSTEAEYTFSLTEDVTLMAVFAKSNANEAVEQASWDVYTENGQIMLHSNTACRYEVYTVSGILVNQGRMDADACSITVDHSGLYMIRRISDTGISVKKVVVR